MATSEDESPDPAAATLWGLVRSAQSEHPGRFVLIDTDGSDASKEALAAALAQAEEPQLALREGKALVPRLASAKQEEETEPPALDPEGTILITGGLSGLGAIAARHLAETHGAKRMLLTSRRGPAAPGAAELIAELAELGCEASAIACDVSERQQLEELLSKVPVAHPLTAVIHCAGVIDDATIESLDPSRLDTVFAPKVDAAWHLHELTKDAELSAFVLYSSGAGVLGGPGQGNYAAANSFLDALAARRHAEELPAVSIAWGQWEQESGMTGALSEADRARLRRLGIAPIETELGLQLLDRARSQPEPFRVAIGVDVRALRVTARAGLASPLLSGLVPAARRRSGIAAVPLARRLEAVPEEKRAALVLGIVREQVAAVLGHTSAEAIDPAAAFKDLGFDSLGAVELRNRLAEATAVSLEATLVFDYPTPDAVAGYLLAKAGGTVGAAGLDPEEERVRGALASIPFARLKESGLLEMLLELSGDGARDAEANEASDIDAMDIDDLVQQTLETAEGA